MKKIMTKKEREKRDQIRQLVVGGVLIFIMILSTFALGFGSKEDSESKESNIEYKGIAFTKSGDYWYFNINNNNFLTKYNPEEIREISFSGLLDLGDYADNVLYFTQEGEAKREIIMNLEYNNQIIKRSQNACLSEQECLGDYPVKNCSKDRIVVIKEPAENEKERIYQDQNCIFIISQINNQTRFADRLLFEVLGV
jgi:uncharacterized protein YneR